MAQHQRRMTANICFLSTLAAVLLAASSCYAQPACLQPEVYPDTTWMRYASSEEAGWSSEGISEAHALADSLGSKAVMLIYKGAVVTEWGDITATAPIYSVRKSLLSALYGIYAAEDEIDTTATLADLGIDDTPPLIEREKRARVADLLTSSSGVYHEAAYEPPTMRKPERGSARPGEQWYYNNWDFNALGAIFEQETEMRIFEAFEERVAEPIGMEDFRSGWGAYHHQPDRSEHPAYTVRMSGRDMARFGLLYEREGCWRDQQIVPADWVEASGQIQKAVPYDPVAGYGLMWWIPSGPLQKHGTYLASGSGSQSIIIAPELDIVFIHRATADLGRGVNGLQVREILHRLIDAQNEPAVDQPQLVPLSE